MMHILSRDRFATCLALVLREETGYAQPVGGPYVRKLHTENGKRYEFFLSQVEGSLESKYQSYLPLPTNPDGMAFDDDPRDPGGRTGMGILQREYDAFRKLCGKERQDVWRIADRELELIYRDHFWDAVRCDQMPAGVDLALFDIAVNQGVGAAVKLLQGALGQKVDGHLGMVTLDAVHSFASRSGQQPDAGAAALVRALSDQRRQRYRNTRNFATFGRNWMERAGRVERLALAASEIGNRKSEIGKDVDDPAFDLRLPTSPSPARASDAEKTVAGSGTVQATTAVAGTGFAAALGEVNRTASETRESGVLDLVLGVLGNPRVLIAALVLALALYIFRERVRRIWQEGV